MLSQETLVINLNTNSWHLWVTVEVQRRTIKSDINTTERWKATVKVYRKRKEDKCSEERKEEQKVT